MLADKWYKLHLHMKDHTGCATFVFFDKEAKDLIQQPVSALQALAIKDEGDELVVNILERLIGNTFIFQIKITAFNVKNPNSNFTISNVFPIDYVLEARRNLTLLQQDIQECDQAADQAKRGINEDDATTHNTQSKKQRMTLYFQDNEDCNQDANHATIELQSPTRCIHHMEVD
ncbi:hypothetical protein L1049_003064 [Liquidambar formosana]|uniref:Uncharacterized protein n=1 Tax=Liquidambar formosana TaxID=63359 RepID=A0AAP0NG43_LIQFO